MKIYRADCRENARNAVYPHEVSINSFSDLKEAARYDHIYAKSKNGRRGKDNFISVDGVEMDLDNNFTNEESFWKTISDIEEALPGVRFSYIRSRNHMKEKSETDPKTGVVSILQAREKDHVYLPFSRQVKNYEECEKIIKIILGLFPYFCPGALDPSHFFFGVEDPQGGEVDGEQTIDQYIETFTDEGLNTLIRENIEEFEQTVERGGLTDDSETALKKLYEFIGESRTADPVNAADPVEVFAPDGLEWIKYEDQKERIEWLKGWCAEHDVTLGTSYKINTHSHPEAIAFCVECPWKDEHSPGEWPENESVIIVELSGQLCFKCRHGHGYRKSWKDFRAYYDEEYSETQKAVREYDAQHSNDKQDLNQFHVLNKNREPTGVFDYKILEDILEKNHIFIIGRIPYIYENGVFIQDLDDTKLRSMIRERIYPQYRKAPTEKRVLDLIKTTNSIQCDFDDMNDYPVHWINFRNGFWDPVEQVLIPHDPKYKAVNQIPHDFYPDRSSGGENIEKMLQHIAPDPEDRKMILQFYGYSLTIDTRQQVFLIVLGTPDAGKSTALKYIEYIVGFKNTCAISLKRFNQRFAAFGLIGKTLNKVADLEVGALEDVSLVKQILGEDTIEVEAKGKDPFYAHSYAKFLFSANELPLVLNEKTAGFYRRLLVLRVNGVPKEKDPQLFEKMKQEKDYFIHLCMDALHDMYVTGKITKSAQSEACVQGLRADSDTIESWLYDMCSPDEKAVCNRTALYDIYKLYCLTQERKELTRNGFYRALRVKDFRETAINGKRMFFGIRIKRDICDAFFRESRFYWESFLKVCKEEEVPFSFKKCT